MGIPAKTQFLHTVDLQLSELPIEIIDNCEVGIIVLDSNKQVVIWNKWVTEHSHLTSEQAKGKNIEELFPKIINKWVSRCIDSTLKQGSASKLSTALHPYPFDLYARKSNKTVVIPQSVTIKPIADKHKLRYCMIQVTDVSHSAIRESLLKDNSIKADFARREAEKLSTIQSEFTAMVSHELRTPLTAIQGALKLISGGTIEPITEKLAPLFDIANRNTDRLLMLINDLLDVHKMEAGKMEYNLNTENLTEIAINSIESNQTYCHKYNIQFLLTQSVDNAPVMVDSNRIQQVISNLLSNAAKFSPAQSVVEISISISNNRARLSIKDSGSGIPEEFHDRIFEQFAQADASNTRISGGTGLGLCISKTIMDEHDGHIWFDTIIGKGTVFYIDLPCA